MATATATLTMSTFPPPPDNDTTIATTTPRRPSITQRTRSSSLLHKNIISRMRPLPFQYVFAMWHTKVTVPAPQPLPRTHPYTNPQSLQPPSSTSPSYSLTCLSPSVPDIATFYRIFNNFPWPSVRPKDSVHFFRAGVKPLWEDDENIDGGCWTVKVALSGNRALRTWEELLLMVVGGELGSVLIEEHDHILGISYSPRLSSAHISIWTKLGSNQKSVELLTNTITARLSGDLRPTSEGDYYFKKHSSHAGWREVVQGAGLQLDQQSQTNLLVP